MQWYLKVLRQYADFTGRAHRTEYWMFVLVSTVISIVLTIVDYSVGLQLGEAAGGAAYGVLSGVYSLAVLLPSLAVAARRLHDTDRSGWWQLITFAPFVLMMVVIPFGVGTPSAAVSVVVGVLALATLVAAVVLIVILATDGSPGSNRFGPNPKAVAHV